MAALEIGEPAPWFAVSAASGEARVVLDELAGRHIVLFLYGVASDPMVASALAGFDERGMFEAGGNQFVGVGMADGPAPQRPGWHFAHDPRGLVARHYGVCPPEGEVGPDGIRPTAFVLSPALQVLAIVAADDATGLIERVVAELEGRRASPPAVHEAPVLIVPNVFDREFCAELVAEYEASGGREIGAIENAGNVVERFDPAFRKRLDWYVSDEAMVGRCRQLLARRLLQVVQRAFQFRVTRIERYLVGCYEAETGGHFHAHRDNTAPVVAHRRFAVTLNLNDSYEGGDLWFPEFSPRTYRGGVGEAVVFSCSLLHEVTPMRRGTRYAFLSFLYDEEAQRVRDEYARKTSGQPAH
jgi:predicted 2-oxoglutarate/Fe(II)-dependent dioxygenase YbiX/peroxiredoxin